MPPFSNNRLAHALAFARIVKEPTSLRTPRSSCHQGFGFLLAVWAYLQSGGTTEKKTHAFN